jgi:hypothetical protein
MTTASATTSTTVSRTGVLGGLLWSGARSAALLSACLCASALPAHAQDVPVAGRIPDVVVTGTPKPVPRLPDGRPNLGNGEGAWNPRVIANLSGSGRGGAARMPVERIVEVPFLPWARDVYDQRMANLSKDDPEARCLPPGVPRVMATPFPFQIYQAADRVIFLFEGAAHVWRVVYTDGRPHSRDPNPSYLGESIGHWEGDTLVVDAIGFNDRTWLDQEGHPHTEALHTIERYTRTSEMTLHYQVTIDDPGAYSRPWTTSFTIPWVPKAELYEYICQENNKDLPHLVGN